MVDPSTRRTLRIYPLDTLTKWEVLDSTVIVICAKTLVYFEAKLTRLKSNSYASNALLDTVTVATVQVLEHHHSLFTIREQPPYYIENNEISSSQCFNVCIFFSFVSLVVLLLHS
ncbi:hypothetical protein VPH35_046934 [Triticum aestivum]|uniref:Uncharacterized protein n=2 Tax=Triticum TaxID=4564 RepID=A0A9R0RVR6_TRITD|nr:unnamed protein product [Triticum turgidum subsp. durum]